MVLILSLAACATPLTNSGVVTNGSSALTTHPDFEAARQAYPRLINALLDENTRLRAEIKELKAK